MRKPILVSLVSILFTSAIASGITERQAYESVSRAERELRESGDRAGLVALQERQRAIEAQFRREAHAIGFRGQFDRYQNGNEGMFESSNRQPEFRRLVSDMHREQVSAAAAATCPRVFDRR